jgi:hypothetical protein
VCHDIREKGEGRKGGRKGIEKQRSRKRPEGTEERD